MAQSHPTTKPVTFNGEQSPLATAAPDSDSWLTSSRRSTADHLKHRAQTLLSENQGVAQIADRGRNTGLSVLRSGPVTSTFQRLTKDRLRILGYHGVSDAQLFDKHMEYVATHYNPVSEEQVIERVQRGTPLPELAVWVTFDDGDPTVVSDGLPSLVRHKIPATMFVCPGLIESGDPFWWKVTKWTAGNRPDVAKAICPPSELTEYVKTLPDEQRRQIIEDLMRSFDGQPKPTWRSISAGDLTTWVDEGMAIGNHSWDHPCLDQCSDDDQRAQIRDAHTWLTEQLGRKPRTFAYPNGNYSTTVDHELEELGYPVAVLYDNALTSFGSPARQLSRLMVESDQSVERLIGVMSGAQPVLRTLASDRF